MSFQVRLCLFLGLAAAAGCILFALPQLDLAAARWFFSAGVFPWRSEPLPNFFHDLVHPVSLGLAAVCVGLLLWRGYKRQPLRPVLFVLLTLVVGPGLITNTLLKDNWGRARPIQITEFGGREDFGPPLLIDDECDDNCSFVGGDAAFGFWFHSFAYVVSRRRRAVFWGGMGVGAGYSLLRVGMGAHFLSDVFFAGVVVLAASASLAALLFGRTVVKERWREFLGG